MHISKSSAVVKNPSSNGVSGNSHVSLDQSPTSSRRNLSSNGLAVSKAASNPLGIRRAANLLKQVSDGTRLQILLLLLESELHVGAICDFLEGQSQPAVSHHLAKLRDGRLIEPRREGKNNVYALTEEGLLLAQTVKSLTWVKS